MVESIQSDNVKIFTDPSELIKQFDLIKDSGFVVCVFTGAVNQETGKNWCPDCDLAKP